MIVELVSVGTELLLGNIVNTNASYLSEKLAILGLDVYYQVVVGDNKRRLEDTIRTAIGRSDIVILTGGLGPTDDDITKETASEVFGLKLYEDKDLKDKIRKYIEESHYNHITNNNFKQALVPEGAKIIPNDNGTACGFILENKDGKKIILLPGPPNELKPMFENYVEKYLNELQQNIIYSEVVKIVSLGESYVAEEIADLIDSQTNPTIAPYAKINEVHLRITARAEDKKSAKKLVKPVVEEIKKRFDKYVYTTRENETLEETVVNLLRKEGIILATAESCTGGMLSSKIINVSGASEIFNQGFVTYSNKSKRKVLGVNKSTIKKYGAVSKETAREMALNVAIMTDSDVGLAITGVAGPNTSEDKPVGLVYIACYMNKKSIVEEYTFKGNRQKIREYATVMALDLLRKTVLENK